MVETLFNIFEFHKTFIPPLLWQNGDHMTLAERLKMYRTQKGLSQEKIAEILGVSRQAVTKWETKATQVTQVQLQKQPSTVHTTLPYGYPKLKALRN